MLFKIIFITLHLLFSSNVRAQLDCKNKISRAIDSVAGLKSKKFEKYLDRIKSKYSADDYKRIQSSSDAKGLEKQFLKSGNKEVKIDFNSIEDARNFTQNHPIFQRLGFSSPTSSPTSEWTKFPSNMKKSAAYKKFVGVEAKLDNGDWARYRIDWDDKIGGHINVEFKFMGQNGKSQTLKFASTFKCQNRMCTEQEFLKIINKIQGN